MLLSRNPNTALLPSNTDIFEVEASYTEGRLVKASKVTIQHVQPLSAYQDYSRLENVLREFIQGKLRTPVTGPLDEELCDKIRKLESTYIQAKEGRWRRMWYRMGSASEMVEPWLGLIPDAYGLAVLKTGVAVVLKLAEHSKEKQEKVFKVF
ncbi:hypothetical protein VTJ49DRAFT_3595 [Mycothermus thermophilus]|uniref:Uncharacterized protein n=1 Tax=Humicola insolens TaxID=85995 RepID=A0ABR3VM41_HUMIN